MRVFIITISILLISFLSFGQELKSKNKKAIEYYKEAEKLDELGNYYESERLLLEALRKDDSFDEAIVLLHQVYLKRDLFSSSESIFLQSEDKLEAIFKNRILADQAYFLYAQGKYPLTKDKLNSIKGDAWQLDSELVENLSVQNEFALGQIKNPLNIEFEDLPAPLNGFDLQYFPSITVQNELIFTARQQLKGGDENLYLSKFDGVDWTVPESVSENINTVRNEGTASISGDGKTLVFTACNRPDNIGSCDLYISYYRNEEWTLPELLPREVNSQEWDSQPSLTADGNTIYFTSLRKGGYGKQDLWYTQKIDGEWQGAINLGSEINSSQDDASPFIYYDSKTLIYASKGRLGMGGYDLYKTVFNKKWSEPSNLGYPINDSFDQVGYTLSYDGWAYFSTSQSDGRLMLKKFRIPEGLVKPLDQTIKLVEVGLDSLSTRQVTTYVGRKSTNHMLDSTFSLPKNLFQNIDSVAIKVKGYKQRFVTSEKAESSTKIELEPFVLGQKLLSQSGAFDFSSDQLSETFKLQLDKLYDYLKINSELIIEIQGHTDLVGGNEFNNELSYARADNVAAYLMSLGLANNRLVVKGFGKTKPLIMATDDTGKINRRVEIVIAKIDW